MAHKEALERLQVQVHLFQELCENKLNTAQKLFWERRAVQQQRLAGISVQEGMRRRKQVEESQKECEKWSALLDNSTQVAGAVKSWL
jgi:hypothetical protein